ncbi:MAG TPA: helix-turn-helix domain-containing protein, partial [Planctomycetaceae bacterium]|nr:helix-turn-helix domain-containing protein [Planctomycetaceae bacterium]
MDEQKLRDELLRKALVAAVRQGTSMRAVAARHGVSLATVQRWVVRAGDQRLDRVDWSETRGGRRAVQATPPDVEELVLQLRRELRDQSDLGEFGAAAIHRTLLERQQVLGLATVPAIR